MSVKSDSDSGSEIETDTVNKYYKDEIKPLLKYIEFTDNFHYRLPFLIDYKLELNQIISFSNTIYLFDVSSLTWDLPVEARLKNIGNFRIMKQSDSKTITNKDILEDLSLDSYYWQALIMFLGNIKPRIFGGVEKIHYDTYKVIWIDYYDSLED